MVGAAGLVGGGGEAVSAGLADAFAAAFVFVVGSDVADALVQPTALYSIRRVRARR